MAWADEGPQSEESASTSEPSDSYLEAGLEFNGFTYANLSIGYWFGPVGINVSGGYIADDSNDLRVDLGYKFYDNGRWRHALHVVGGQTEGSDPGADYNYSYVGLAYELNFRGFHTILGLGKDVVDRIGNLDEDPVVPVGALIGYQYQFR